MAEPLEIVIGTPDIWVGPVGEAVPLPDVVPVGNWLKLGNAGNYNYDESGVVVTHSQTLDFHRVAGASGPVKASRSSEDLMIAATVFDITILEYTRIINDIALTNVPAASGVAGYDYIQLRKGLVPAEFALLVRGVNLSPALAAHDIQYEVLRVVIDGEVAVTYSKSSPAGLNINFMALEDSTQSTDVERFGRLVIVSTVAV